MKDVYRPISPILEINLYLSFYPLPFLLEESIVELVSVQENNTKLKVIKINFFTIPLILISSYRLWLSTTPYLYCKISIQTIQPIT